MCTIIIDFFSQSITSTPFSHSIKYSTKRKNHAALLQFINASYIKVKIVVKIDNKLSSSFPKTSNAEDHNSFFISDHIAKHHSLQWSVDPFMKSYSNNNNNKKQLLSSRSIKEKFSQWILSYNNYSHLKSINEQSDNRCFAVCLSHFSKSKFNLSFWRRNRNIFRSGPVQRVNFSSLGRPPLIWSNHLWSNLLWSDLLWSDGKMKTNSC